MGEVLAGHPDERGLPVDAECVSGQERLLRGRSIRHRNTGQGSDRASGTRLTNARANRESNDDDVVHGLACHGSGTSRLLLPATAPNVKPSSLSDDEKTMQRITEVRPERNDVGECGGRSRGWWTSNAVPDRAHRRGTGRHPCRPSQRSRTRSTSSSSVGARASTAMPRWTNAARLMRAMVVAVCDAVEIGAAAGERLAFGGDQAIPRRPGGHVPAARCCVRRSSFISTAWRGAARDRIGPGQTYPLGIVPANATDVDGPERSACRRPGLGFRAWLAVALVFGTSAAVLVLEILASRLLAPYVGVSLETYTGIIGTILAGIAVGAWAGGVLADRVEPAAAPSGALDAWRRIGDHRHPRRPGDRERQSRRWRPDDPHSERVRFSAVGHGPERRPARSDQAAAARPRRDRLDRGSAVGLEYGRRHLRHLLHGFRPGRDSRGVDVDRRHRAAADAAAGSPWLCLPGRRRRHPRHGPPS